MLWPKIPRLEGQVAKQSWMPNAGHFRTLVHAYMPPYCFPISHLDQEADQQNPTVYSLQGRGECKWGALPIQLANGV